MLGSRLSCLCICAGLRGVSISSKGKWAIPFRFPAKRAPGPVPCVSIAVEDRVGFVTGFRYLGLPIAVCGRKNGDEGGRLPELTLLEKELFETFRIEVADGGRIDDPEEEKDVWRAGPAKEDAFPAPLTGLELGAAGAILARSPTTSTRVLRSKLFGGGAIADERALLADADISKSFPGDGIWLGCRNLEGNYSITIKLNPV